MKKNLFYLIVFGVSMMTISCSKNTDESLNELESSDLSLMRTTDSCSYGDIHNDFMSIYNDDFQINQSITSKTVGYNYIINFFKSKSNDYENLNESEIDILDSSFTSNIELLETLKLNSLISNDETMFDPFSNNQTTLSNLINELQVQNVISNTEYQELINLQNFLDETFKGRVSNTEFNNYLDEISARIDGKGYKLLEPIICIGNSSNNWWRTNTPDIGLPIPLGDQVYPSGSYTTYAIPVVVANDIAGAIIGGVGAATYQYVGTGSVNWKVVGIATVGGAIVGSLGVLGKLSKWIQGW
jgi:hypothetical protein